MDWTLAIAVGGFVIALVSFGWNIYLHLASRPKVKVTASMMRMHPKPPGIDQNAQMLLIEAVNLRARPVTITGFHGTFCKPTDGKESQFWLIPDPKLASISSPLPCSIKEAEVARFLTVASSLDDLDNIKDFFVLDSTGRKWNSRMMPLRSSVA